MTDIALLAYVPDPFAVRKSEYMVHSQSGIVRLTAQEISDYPAKIMTYDLPALVDDLRRHGHSPPREALDIGDAIRLVVGRSKDEGGERLWSSWSALKQRFEHPADAESFEKLATSRIERPESTELSKLLDAAAVALRRLWEDLVERLKTVGELDRLIQVEWPLQSLFSYRQFRGIRVDTQGANALLARISAEKYSAYTEVARALDKSPTELNFWNVHPYLTRTDVAHLSDVEAGGRLEDAFEIAASSSKFASAFLSLVKASRDEAVVRRALGGAERLYPIFNVMGTVSGRILVSDPHLQQLRRSYRSLIVADENMRLAYLDYAQFEPGVIAGLSQDNAFLAAYNAGDVYTSLAQLLFGTADSRPAAKRVFLAFLYGMTTNRIASLLAGSAGLDANQEAYAEKIEEFFTAYPGLAAYRVNQEQNLLNDGYVSSVFGNRRVRFGNGPLNPKERRWALNQPVQSTASLIFKEALIDIANEFGPEQIILPVHDAVLMQFAADEAFDGHVARARDLMIRAFNRRMPNVNARVTVGTF